MGRCQGQRANVVGGDQGATFQRHVLMTGDSSRQVVGSTQGSRENPVYVPSGAAARPLTRSPQVIDDEEYLNIEPNEKGSSFSDQFFATIWRIVQQKRQAWIGTLLEFAVPFLFLCGAIILWAAFGNDINPERQVLNYTSVSSITLPELYKQLMCNNVSMGIVPGLADCRTVGFSYDCSGDESSLPVKGLCVNATMGARGMIGFYMNAILGNAVRVPPLDTMIMMQWIARKAAAGNTETATSAMLATAGLTPSTRYDSIMNSGMLYFAPRAGVPASLITYLNDTAQYFQYVYGGTFDTVEEAENYVKTTQGFHWAIVEVKAFNTTDFDVVLHMNSTALPHLTDVVDTRYPGGYQFDRGEMYTASGFNTLQESLYQCYLQELGYTDVASIHPYTTSFGYQEYKENTLLRTATPLIAFILVLSFLYPVVQLTKTIVLEKELRIREAMLIMGLSNTSLYLSWFVIYALQYVAMCIFMAMLLKLTFVSRSDAFVLFMTFYIFALSTIPLSGLIATFFSKARLVSMLAPLIFFALAVPTFAFTSASTNVIISVCILSPTAFAVAVINILTLEVGSGFGPKDFHNTALTLQSFIIYLLLAVDFLAYFVLMLYFDAVLPKEWGTTKHPLFFIINPVKWLCRCCGKEKVMVTGTNEDGRAENGVFEDADDSEAAVQIVGLRKEYSRGGKTFVAVNNLYWSMNQNEISVMLGHNGAGKTTTMNMMTGMVSADAGDCYIHGSSVRTQLHRVRQQIGYCPQHNILWPELTCRDHLEYYGKIKGLSGTVLEDAVQLILKQVDLLDKIEYASCALSGGQKRKLSVAIAFVGCSRLIFLDEPTAGMDAAARRYTWELLRRMSEAHTIMLTTHFMDEADLLGHKIGIMSQGCLKCSGSSLFLKSRLGLGYSMNISVNPEVEAVNIDRFIVSLVPNAEALDFNGCEIVYRLPMRDLELFPSMLASLEENGEDIGIRGYSLSATTLEEVFLQIALEDMKKHKESSFVEENETLIQEEINAVWCCEIMTGTRDRLVSQFKSMMVKRLWNALRDRRMQCFQVICPVVCILLAMVLTVVKFTETGFIDLSSEMFGETVQMQVSGCEAYFGATHNVTRQGSYITDLHFASAADLSFYATDTALQLEMPRYTSLFCGDPGLQDAVPFELDAAILFYNTSAYHASGLVLQQLYTYILQSFTNSVNRTFQTGIKLMPAPTSLSKARGGVDTILIGAIIMIPFTFLPSNVVAWVVKERECKARHLQNVSGLSFYIYWLTNFLFDIVAYILTVTMVLLIFLMFSRDEYVGKDTAGPTIVSFLIYGVCSTAGGYVLSFLFDEHSTAQSVTMAISFTAGFLFVMMVFILSLVDSTKDASVNLRWVFRLVPSYCVGESIINLAMDRQQAALGLPSNPWGMDVVGWSCVFMTVEFPIFVLATLFIDHPRRRMWGQKGAYVRSAPAEVIDDEDSDVEDERNQVYQQESNKVNDDVVRVVDLRKVYASGKVAVRNLAFSILPDEVFGFLGTNGAGKTTTISMLCQEFIPTSGSAFVCGYDIVSESEKALRCIGYCPQFDATLDLLTVEEHLHLYAGVRGIRYEDRSKVVAGLMRLCEITEYKRTTAAQLSGGNRRKLSVALALIGSPQIIFLDEPSAGMDPVARRGLWKAIQKVSQNCSVVLTTHHLEEVEELADTVAIMTDGALRCIGDKTHLKQKYGSGFEMSIRIARKDMRMAVQHFVQRHFPTAVLHEFKGQRFVFGLPADTKLSQMFWHLQQNKAQLHITDYSVSQASIEQMFLRICEEQNEREARTVEKEVHFVKSHATLPNYKGSAMRGCPSRKGNRRGERCREKPAEAVVMVSSSAIEEYRRRMREADVEF